MVTPSYAKVDTRMQVLRGNVLVGNEAVIVFVDKAKNKQISADREKFPMVAISGSILCPVKAFKHYFRLVPARDNYICFTLLVNKVLTYDKFHQVFRETVSRAGYDAQRYSSHSLCRGGTSWSYKDGVPEQRIKLMGNWCSNCFQRYITIA